MSHLVCAAAARRRRHARWRRRRRACSSFMDGLRWVWPEPSKAICRVSKSAAWQPSALAVLDRPRRHVHRHRRAPARRLARHPQAAVGEPRAVSRRGDRRHPPPARRAAGRADPGRADRGGEDGHDRRHQRAARAQGRAHGAVHHARLPRPAAHRLPEPPAHLRPPHRAAGAALHARWSRSTSASARTARWCGRSTRRGARASSPRRAPRASARSRSCSCTATAIPRTRRASRELAREAGFDAGLRLARGEPADEDRLARRHDGGGRVPVADPAALRGPGRRASCRARA